MQRNIDYCLDSVIKHEGGYAERPTEHGGAVNYGVTFDTFKAWRTKNAPDVDVTFADLKAMTRDEAKDIFADMYMKPIMFDTLPDGVDYAVFDAAINGGIGGATRLLQQALGHAVTGKFTLTTRWGARHRHPIDLINRICDARLATNKNFTIYDQPIKEGSTKTWGQVWAARVEVVRKRAVTLYEKGLENA